MGGNLVNTIVNTLQLLSQYQVNSVSFLLHFTGDIAGKILAWCSLLPIFIVVGFITLIVFRREIHTVSHLI